MIQEESESESESDGSSSAHGNARLRPRLLSGSAAVRISRLFLFDQRRGGRRRRRRRSRVRVWRTGVEEIGWEKVVLKTSHGLELKGERIYNFSGVYFDAGDGWRTYVATWSDEEYSTENEVAHLCFMTLQVGEVTYNSSSSNSYTFDDLQEAYDELVFKFKASFSKNKKLISKLKLENERLFKTNLEFEAKLKEYETNIFLFTKFTSNLEKRSSK
ncbi:hypothetical protein GQ457_06G012830 [Hibiscus cannabinus]